jgi:peptidoglycan/xylan/chitin deacetylase (PgdA/CDA1 family)
MMRAFFTVDVEQDCPPFRSSYHGIEQGLPKLAELFKQKKIKATFFVTGDVARRYPSVIQDLVNDGHEIGCHGDTHARFDQMSFVEAQRDIQAATETLRHFYPVVSFRAPNLQFPEPYLKILAENGYLIDSSEGRHKKPWLKVRSDYGMTRVPVSTTSLVLRLKPRLRRFFLSRMCDPIVLFVHPWEFVDLQKEDLRFDCRWRTGAFSLTAAAESIDYFVEQGTPFCPLHIMMDPNHRFL